MGKSIILRFWLVSQFFITNVFPEAVHEVHQDLQWVTEVGKQMQPHFDKYLSSQIKTQLEARIGGMMTKMITGVTRFFTGKEAFHFQSFNVSMVSVNVGRISVLKQKNTSLDGSGIGGASRPIKLDLTMALSGPVDIRFKAAVATVQLSEITVKTKSRVTLVNPNPEPPFVSGFQLSLLEKPWIDLKFEGGATRMIAERLLGEIDQMIEEDMGYPNTMARALKTEADMRLVKSLNPTGVLAVYIKSAKDLKLEDSFVKKMFGYDKPDTYVKTQLGMAKFQTEPVMNDANPTFKANGTGSQANWFELPLDTLEGYSLDFHVYERSPTKDVLYGTAHIHNVETALKNLMRSNEMDNGTQLGGLVTLNISLSDHANPEEKLASSKSTAQPVKPKIGGQLLVDMKWIPLISGGPKANTTVGGNKNDSVPSDGENATEFSNKSKENVRKPAGEWRPLDETEILKTANVSKVKKENNTGGDGGQKDEWTKKDLKMTPQNRSRRSTWEIDTKKSFGFSTPVRNIPAERKLRSVEESDEKVKEKNETKTNLKCNYGGKSEKVAMLWLESAEIEPQMLQDESGAAKAKLLIGRERMDLWPLRTVHYAIRPVGDEGTSKGGPSRGVEVLFNSSRNNTAMNVSGTNGKQIRATIHQELLFMISGKRPRYQDSLDFSLSSDQWDKPLHGNMKIVDTLGKAVSVPLIECEMPNCPSAKSKQPDAKRSSSVINVYLTIRYLKPCCVTSICSTQIENNSE